MTNLDKAREMQARTKAFAERMEELLDEANELLCIFGSALRTAKRRPVS